MPKGFSVPRLALLALAIAAMVRGPANAASLEEIKARGTLLIGAEIASPPYISRDNDEIVGYEPDILAEMAKRLGVKLKIVDSAWSGILPSLIAGKFDAVFAGMTVTKDRLAKVFFTTPYANDPVSILVYTNSDIHAIQDMSGKRLGFAFGGALDQFINGYNATLIKEGRAPMELKTYDTPLDAIADLQNRRLDAALNKRTTLNRVIATRTKGQFRVVSDMKAMVDLSFLIAGAVPKDDPTLLAFMNATLRDMKESGKLAALQRKWFGEEMDVPVDIPTNLP